MTAWRWIAGALLVAAPAMADPAEIVSAEAERVAEGWRVSVTLRHADTGWDDYADGWRVWADGAVIGTRVLAHPHVEEQPFTRSLTLAIPEGAAAVEIEASTSATGWGGARLALATRLDQYQPRRPSLSQAPTIRAPASSR